ncbi:hypothetical protein SG34_031770 [Thalassomonas viridans]|uniref:Porin n=1 Tax=Thalassomonas viridans TaxID=137584 RepID=A0AAE9ZCA8_9GAMM|nr:hypothetical protein SG34_031770 [Thalassomonas viridans]
MALLAAGSVLANEFSGHVASQTRLFMQAPAHQKQQQNDASASANLEYYHDWDGGNQRIAFSGFSRYDNNDSERTHSDIRELYYWRAFAHFELYAGARQVFWGVTETVHLVDIVNQDDAIENIDGEDKLGQPMVSVLVERDWGTLEAFALLGFRERTFAGDKGRLRPQMQIDANNALYQSSAGQQHLDFALRWSQVFGDWDVGISHFDGTSRDPLFIATPSADQETTLTPFYAQIQQSGIDVQATLGDWALKLEAVSVKEKAAGRNTALVSGFEYTLFGIGNTDADLGLLMEYQFDDRSGIRRRNSQNDLALGMRYTLNDVEGTELLFSLSRDLDNSSRFYSLEASRRLNNYWTINAEARLFSNMDENDPGFDLRDDDYLELELRRYF